MNPTLKNLDLLKVVPYSNKKIRPGDVIVFHPPGESKKITHRVISVNQGKIIARGDNNLAADPWPLRRENILGQVLSAQRGEKEIIISALLNKIIHLLTVNCIPEILIYLFFCQRFFINKFIIQLVK